MRRGAVNELLGECEAERTNDGTMRVVRTARLARLGGVPFVKRLPIVVIGLVVVGATVAGLALRKGQPKPVEYRTASAERGDVIATVSATGTLKPVEEVTVGSQVSGTVAAITVDYNDPVAQGQVIARLDDRFLRAQLQQSDANVQRASVAVEDAKRTYARAQELLGKNLIPEAERDAARLAVLQREAELKQTQAARELAQVNIEHTVIRAPISGVIVSRSVDVGQTVAASLQAPDLFTIARDLEQMQVEASIDEADVGTVAPGMHTTFTVDAYPDMTFDGRVQEVRLEPLTVQNVVTYTAIIRAGNPDMLLKPGMTANVSITTAEAHDVLRVPNAALRFRPEGAKRGQWGGGPGGGARMSMSGASGARAADEPAPARRRPPMGGVRSMDAAPRDSSVPERGRPPVDGMGGPPDGRPRPTPEQRERMRAHMDSIRAAGGDPREAFRGMFRGERGGENADAPPRAVTAAPPPRGGRTREQMDAAMAQSARRIAEQTRPGTVYVLGADGKPQPVRVVTGVSDGTFSAVVRGDLPPDAKVVVGIKLDQKSGPAMTSPLTQGPVPPPGGGTQGRPTR